MSTPPGLYLLDASALLALINNEDGADVVAKVLDHSVIHAVNLAEVARKLRQKGMPLAEVMTLLKDLHLAVICEFSEDQAYQSALWVSGGISLGDSICLSTARVHSDRKIVTADRSWSELNNVGEILQIR